MTVPKVILVFLGSLGEIGGPVEPVGFLRHDISASWAHESTSFFDQHRQWNSVMYIFLVGCHPSDSHLASQFVDYCKWLVNVASLLAPKPHLLLFFVLIGLDIVKTLPRCYLQTYIEEPVLPAKKHRQQQHRIPCDAFIRQKITQAVWKMIWHFQVQIKHIVWQTFFCMNVLSNMNTGNGIQLLYAYFWSDATLLTLTWQVSL